MDQGDDAGHGVVAARRSMMPDAPWRPTAVAPEGMFFTVRKLFCIVEYVFAAARYIFSI